jgi:hypothetical protein
MSMIAITDSSERLSPPASSLIASTLRFFLRIAFGRPAVRVVCLKAVFDIGHSP